MEITDVGVVGLGTMGAGIVEVFARAGLAVVGVEANEELAAAGGARVEKSLARARNKGRLTPEDYDAVLARVRVSTTKADLVGVGLVIEAVPERLDIKAALFAELDQICPPHTVFATNTSSLPVTRIAAGTGRPDRVVGMHFFNPAPVMRLVEVVSSVLSDAAVVSDVRALAESCGKSPVVVGDRAGFVANALLFGYLNDAARMAETGRLPIEAIDAGIREATGFPMGPLALIDLIGLDVSLEVLEVMYDETRDGRYAPAPLLKRLVMARRLGRKTGSGYYDYSGEEPAAAVTVAPVDGARVPDRDDPAYLAETLLYPHLDDAVRMLDDNYASRDDIDTAMRLGCGYPRGPFAMIADLGPATVAAGLERRGRMPSPLLRHL